MRDDKSETLTNSRTCDQIYGP